MLAWLQLPLDPALTRLFCTAHTVGQLVVSLYVVVGQ